MRKILLASFAFVLMASAAFGAVSVGDMNVYNFDDIKLHSYATGDNMNDYCYLGTRFD